MYYLGTRFKRSCAQCTIWEPGGNAEWSRDPLKKQEEGKYKIIGAEHQKVK